LAAGDIEKAEPLVSKVLEAKPRFARAHFAMGRLMEKKGELRKAMEEYRQACELAFRGE
jgi:Tfp pilus assembly protein PilF